MGASQPRAPARRNREGAGGPPRTPSWGLQEAAASLSHPWRSKPKMGSGWRGPAEFWSERGALHWCTRQPPSEQPPDAEAASPVVVSPGEVPKRRGTRTWGPCHEGAAGGPHKGLSGHQPSALITPAVQSTKAGFVRKTRCLQCPVPNKKALQDTSPCKSLWEILDLGRAQPHWRAAGRAPATIARVHPALPTWPSQRQPTRSRPTLFLWEGTLRMTGQQSPHLPV